MKKNLYLKIHVLIFFILPIKFYSQKDVTKFLGVPVDGNKSEMILRLKEKGYSISPYNKDILIGEFNGNEVNIQIVTNNNKVWRIVVTDKNSTDEANIKIRFNNLISQFQNNRNYRSLPDSTIVKYKIPLDEDLSYGLSVKKKRYEALFYQQLKEKDSITLAKEKKEFELKYNSLEGSKKSEFLDKYLSDEIEKYFTKTVWFVIFEDRYGKYYIAIYYDNDSNKAKGEGL